MSGKIAAERLAANQTIIVKGKTSFSRLARHVSGKELEDSVRRAKAAGRLYPTDRDHTTIWIVDAEVQYADPANPTLEEQFIVQQLFTYKKGDNTGRVGYSIDDTSPFIPLVLVPDEENPGSHRQLVLESDLASGLDVRVVLSTFKSKAGYQKTGVGLQQVVLDEAPKYYTQGVNTGELAARGITVSGGITRVSAEDAAAAAAPQAAAQGSYVGTDENGFPTAGPVAPQAQAPAAPAPQAQAPVQPAAPAPAPAPAPQAQAPAPVAQAPAQPAAPAPQAQAPAQAEGTPEQKIARLQAQLDAARNSGQAAGTSAFDQGQAPTQNPDPWD